MDVYMRLKLCLRKGKECLLNENGALKEPSEINKDEVSDLINELKDACIGLKVYL